MLSGSKPYTLDRIARIGITAGLLWGLVWLLGYLSDVLIPFAVAFLLAYLISPLVVFVQKKVPSRAAAVFISLFAVAASGVLLAWLVVPMIAEEIGETGRILSELVNNSDLAERAAKRLPPNLWEAVKNYAAREEVQAFFRTDSFWKIAEAVARKILPGVWGFIAGTDSFVMALVGLVVIVLYLVFLLVDYERVRQGWKSLLPPTYQEPAAAFVGDFTAAMNRHFRAQGSIAAIVGVLFASGFWLIDLPMGIVLGLFVGLLNMVPYLQVVGLIPAFLLALVHALEAGTSLWVALGLTGLVFVIVQAIQDTMLTPRIMGKATGLRPAIILLSLSVWGKLLGFFGLLIALPMTCLLSAYYRRFLASTWAEVSSTPPASND
jgi:predicted PurR-regulated permease PerM